jgi:hypothetical protein
MDIAISIQHVYKSFDIDEILLDVNRDFEE